MDANQLFMTCLWLLCGIISASIASRRGATVKGFLVGTVLGPFSIFMAQRIEGTLTPCQRCQREIQNGALICPFCRKENPWGRVHQPL